jgi:hypothetical protein
MRQRKLPENFRKTDDELWKLTHLALGKTETEIAELMR